MPPKMHATTRRKFGSFNLKTLSAAVVSALLLSNAHAAGLGKLTVLSSLGQPLRAEIELTIVSKDETGTLVAKLASAEAFRQANIDFNPALLSMRFSVEQRGDRQFIRVTSTQPLNEPFVDMLLDLNGPQGRLVREYTFLLDPPDLRATQTAQAALAPAPEPNEVKAPQPQAAAESPTMPIIQTAPPGKPAVPQKQQQAVAPKAAKTVKAVKAAPASSSESKGKGQAEEYQVKKGDTLARIAGQFKSSGISLDQMLVALYQANPDAFIGNNMNRLKAGRILAVPGSEAVRAVDKTEARGIVQAQSVDFNNYRSKLAGHVEASAPQKSAETKQSAGGKITAKVEEKATPAGESKDKLKLSNAMGAPGKNADKAAGTTSAEDKIAKEKAAAEANARVKELEKNVGDLQKVLEVKNKNLAEQQKQAETAKAEAKPAAPAPEASKDAKTGESANKQTTTPAASAPAVPAASAPAAPPVKKPKPAAPKQPEPSLVDELMSNPALLPGLGALLVVLGGLGIYGARRKKSKQFEDSIITDSSLKANSLFGSTGGQSVDTNNSMFNSSFVPSASQLDTNEVDPVAEADVYIAYGRDAQAEEILKEALRTQPARHAVRVKLLEIYSNRKDRRAFEALATELYGLTNGEGPEWTQAAALGIVIDPSNPLYAGKDVKDAEPASAAPSSAPQMEATPEQPEAFSSKLDFEAQGMDQAKASDAMPASAESVPDLSSIDFNFLDESAPTEAAAESESASKPESLADFQIDATSPLEDLDLNKEETAGKDAPLELPTEAASLDLNISGLPTGPATPEAESGFKNEVDPLDFDLSGISLDLNPGQKSAKSDSAQHDDFSLDLSPPSADTEMATKLDLAIAYQEIGDKEGARELLDEVVKGGTPEQSEKAKSLLLELT